MKEGPCPLCGHSVLWNGHGPSDTGRLSRLETGDAHGEHGEYIPHGYAKIAQWP